MVWSFAYIGPRRVLELLMLLTRTNRAKEIEILVLRHQIAVLCRQVTRPELKTSDRVLLAALSRLLPRKRWQAFFITPATLLRWHRDLLARRWTYPRKHPGRPPTTKPVRDLVIRLATDNPQWGYQRITGELLGLGHRISPGTVRNILIKAGLDPAPRRRGPTWTQFLTTQAKSIIAVDFFHIDTVTLQRIYVFFCIEHASRYVHILGVTRHPTAAWVIQQARNLMLALTDRGLTVRFLIRDRDAKYTSGFDEVFTAAGAEVIKTPVRAPRANAICERWIGTLRRECTDRILIWHEHHLRTVLKHYATHYNTRRPHRSLGHRPPASPPQPPEPIDLNHARIHRRKILNGLINEYDAA